MESLITPAKLFDMLDQKNVIMIDSEEYFGKEPNNIFGDIYYHFDQITPDIMAAHKCKNIVVYCNHGISSRFFSNKLRTQFPEHTILTLDGGSDALTKDTGMACALKLTPIKMTITRQICSIAGALVLTGGLTSLMWPGMVWLTIGIGAGLCLSGLTGWCAMASLLIKMPWNR